MGNMIPVASFKTTITNAISSSATTIPIDAVTDDAGNSLNALVLGFLIDRGLSTEEFIIGTVDYANSQLTSVTRGISTLDGQTSVAALKFAHRKKATIEITDHPYLTLAMRQLDGTDSLTGVPKNPSSRTISNSRHLADKEYVDLVAVTAGGISAFLVSDAGGITIDVGSGYLVSSDGVIAYAGAAGQALTDNATNYVELKPDGTLTINTTGFTAGYAPLAIVTTLSSDITVLTDARGWLTAPAPERVISTDFTYGDTITAGDPLYYDTATSKVKKALGTGASTADSFIGVALDAGVDTDTKKRIQLGGLVTSGVSGLTPGFQYLTNAGGYSTTAGTYKKLIGYAPTATSLILFPGIRADDISGGNSSLTAANLNEAATAFANTDITGAELETLSASATASADTLHTHDWLTQVEVEQVANANATIRLDFSDFTSSTNGAASFSANACDWEFQAANTADSYIIKAKPLTTGDSGNVTYSQENHFSDTDLDLSWTVAFGTTATSRDAIMGFTITTPSGVPATGTSTAVHAAFLLTASTLYASVANGTTQSRTDVSSGITFTNHNNYRIVWTHGSDAKFYINGTLVATLSTNIPTDSTSTLTIAFGIEAKTTAYRGMKLLKHPTIKYKIV